MAVKHPASLLADLRTLFIEGPVRDESDESLLRRFASRTGPGSDVAFAALVHRHGDKVWRVCLAILGEVAEAEDAFQATFIVLARRSASLRSPEQLAPWLVGVARRVARKAKSRLARQRAHELAALLAVSLESGDTTRSVELDEEARAVCEEVGRLPAKYRTPVSLCYLAGLTHEEAAASLSWPVGTIRGRLSRARSLLRCRLTRRGLAPAAVATAVSPAQAVAPRRLIEAAIFAASRGATDAASAEATFLAKEVLRAMTLIKFQAAAVLGAIVCAHMMFFFQVKAGPPAQVPQLAIAQAPAHSRPSYRMIGSVKVLGTAEPVSGATLEIIVGDGPGHRLVLRSGRSGQDGMLSIDLPPGISNRNMFVPPPGFWAPGNCKPSEHEGFLLSADAPTFRKDYVVRRGTIWEFSLTSFGKPAAGGSIISIRPDGNGFQAVANESGIARLTLPTEQGHADLWLTSPGDALWSRRLIETASWDAGFLPGAVKTIAKQDGKYRLQDRDGRSAMLGNGGGRIEPVIENGVLLIRVRLNDLDPDAQGTISGTVLDSRGLPVERAWVSLAFVYREGGGALPSNSVCHTVTNAGGEFLIRSVPKNLNGVPLQFSLVVSKDGLAGTDTPPVEFRPQGRDSIHRVDPVRLGVEGTIRGKVLDDRGLPAVGARVSPGSHYSARSRSTRTDEMGRFVVRGIPRETAELSVYHGGQEASEHVMADGSSDITIRLQQTAKIREKELETRRRAGEARMKRVQPLAVSNDAPAWSLGPWSDGQARVLKDYHGRVVLLVFWSTWCAPCVKDLPNLEALRKTYEPRGLVVLSIHTAQGEAEKIRRILKQNGANFPFAIDRGEDTGANGETADRYGVPSYPTLVIVDRGGKVAFHSVDPALKGRARGIARELKIAEETMSAENRDRIDGALLNRELDAILTRP